MNDVETGDSVTECEEEINESVDEMIHTDDEEEAEDPSQEESEQAFGDRGNDEQEYSLCGQEDTSLWSEEEQLYGDLESNHQGYRWSRLSAEDCSVTEYGTEKSYIGGQVFDEYSVDGSTIVSNDEYIEHSLSDNVDIGYERNTDSYDGSDYNSENKKILVASELNVSNQCSLELYESDYLGDVFTEEYTEKEQENGEWSKRSSEYFVSNEVSLCDVYDDLVHQHGDNKHDYFNSGTNLSNITTTAEIKQYSSSASSFCINNESLADTENLGESVEHFNSDCSGGSEAVREYIREKYFRQLDSTYRYEQTDASPGLGNGQEYIAYSDIPSSETASLDSSVSEKASFIDTHEGVTIDMYEVPRKQVTFRERLKHLKAKIPVLKKLALPWKGWTPVLHFIACVVFVLVVSVFTAVLVIKEGKVHCHKIPPGGGSSPYLRYTRVCHFGG